MRRVVQGYLREGSTLVEIGAPVLGSALSSQFKVVSAFRDAPLVNAPAPPPGAPAEVAQRPQWYAHVALHTRPLLDANAPMSAAAHLSLSRALRTCSQV